MTPDAVTTFARLLWQPGDVREVRIPKANKYNRTVAGYFSDPDRIAAAVAPWDGKKNIYLTVNPVDTALLARADENGLSELDTTTSDPNVLRRRWLFIDIDAKRPTGISATDAEVEATKEVARSIASHLLARGWALPITAMSGNGHYLVYPVDLANDADSLALVNGVLGHLGATFDTEFVKVDTSVGNAARIMGLVGTLKVKGRSTDERPHRRSAILHAPDELPPVPVKLLHELLPAKAKASGSTRTKGIITIGDDGLPPGWVKSWLDDAGVVYREQPPDARSTVYYDLERCPWHPDDGTFECGPGEQDNGMGAFHGFHDRCTGKTWHDLRATLGLGPRQDPPIRPEAEDEDDVEDEVDAPDLASAPRILDAAAVAVKRLGVAGEQRTVKLIYLIVVSRLLDRIVSLAVKGPSSAGKSWLVETVLRLFPTSACHVLSAFSERALIYDDAPLQHRMLVIYEATGMAGDVQTYIVRSLLSEGHVRYITVEKGKGGLKPRTIDRQGPTGLITTTTELRLHPENETRLMSLTVSDTPEQTKAVLAAYASGPQPVDLQPWHQLQRWLEQGSNTVVVPYALTLAGAIPPVAVRLRRDFPSVIALIKAHALLHQVSRERDDDGAVVATFADYAAVRDLVADLVADAAERSVPETIRTTAETVAALTKDGTETTVLAVAGVLKLDKSAASRRVRAALDRGYLKNLEEKRGRPHRLVNGDPLPEDQVVLPERDDLERLHERLHGCSASEGGSNSVDGAYITPTRAERGERVQPPQQEASAPSSATARATAGYIPPDTRATVQPLPAPLAADPDDLVPFALDIFGEMLPEIAP